MEDSQVLDAESKAAPLQAPEAIHETSQTITPKNETPTKNIYGGPSPVVGEKNHADEISTQINRSDYSFKSPVDNSKEPTVTTVSTTKGNVTDKAYWQAHYGMNDTYKAKAGEDYSWNKLAQERSQYTYEQEATQVLSDYAKSMAEIKEAGSEAMEQYFSAAYSANQTADKMGWQGGQVTSNDAKTAFLKASTAARMYDKFELQKYGVESQLTVARLYAEANMEALALDLYQDAINTAVREAELTGWYIAPEASEIMKQQKVANEILANKNSSEAERQRANSVIGAGNAYFDKLGFQKDEYGHYIGVETLANLEYQETVRANKENERLQQDANDIARDAVAATREATAASTRLGELQLQQTYALTEATKRLGAMQSANAFKASDGNYYSEVTKINGTYQNVYDVQEKNGKYYGKINGDTYQLTPNDQGFFDSSGKLTSEQVEALNRKDTRVSDAINNTISNAKSWIKGQISGLFK